MFAIVNIVKASGSTAIDSYALAGMMVMAVMPTTVASNITMVSFGSSAQSQSSCSYRCSPLADP